VELYSIVTRLARARYLDDQLVDRLRDFVVPYVRRDSSLHIATQVDWNSKECSRGQPPYLTSKGRGEHSMAEKRQAKRRC
jgi:hypothetical protein